VLPQLTCRNTRVCLFVSFSSVCPECLGKSFVFMFGVLNDKTAPKKKSSLTQLEVGAVRIRAVYEVCRGRARGVEGRVLKKAALIAQICSKENEKRKTIKQ
jgi:hypothetical protein